jgi:hypothetical protein
VRIVRSFSLLAAVALAAVPLMASASGAQEVPDLTATVRKVVVGTGAPSAVTADCQATGGDAEAFVVDVLNFDGQGHPVPSGGDTDWEILDGAWVLRGGSGDGGTCTYTETSTGGATSTSFTCAYTFEPNAAPAAAQALQAGCLSASGTGAGPVQVNYPGQLDVSEQASTVVFTNTFTTTPLQPIQPAAAVVVTPAFTG